MKGFGLRAGIIFHDLVMVAVAWCTVYLVRHGLPLEREATASLLSTLPYVVIVQGAILWWVGLYRSLWRFASVPDLWNIFRAVGLGILTICLTLFIFNRFGGVPRSSFLLYPVFLVFFLGGPRLAYRMWKEHGFSVREDDRRQRVLLLGAGRAGEMLARDMKRDDVYRAVGFLDDKKSLRGAKVHGVPVIGRIDMLSQVVAEMAVDIVVISMPSANSLQMQRVVQVCEESRIPFRTLPRLQDMTYERSAIQALREVAIEDFLGREPILLEWKNISEGLAGKIVLITGGGGSIGAELSRQIAQLGPASLILLDQSEFNLYSVEQEVQHEFPVLKLHCYLGDVCDRVAVEHILATHRPQVIFHAAAYKHVPLLQAQPREAIRNNVVGTKTIAVAADKYGCSTFVLISTDKAVNPTNVMGASKRVSEIFCHGLNARSTTKYITVRFGNVLGSAGSVVPHFQKQIQRGGPVTVTHPDITRYFMTIPEACQLIMQAAVMGKGGEIFVLDMGEPIKIRYLAEQMIRLAGKAPGRDVEIVYSGLRPGEKLYEELFYDLENLSTTRHKKILLARSNNIDWDDIMTRVGAIEQANYIYDKTTMMRELRTLVPGFRSDDDLPEGNVIELKKVSN